MVTLVVETGAGIANANSYVALLDQKAYLASHPFGAATLALSDDVISAGMVQCFRVLNSAATYKGTKVTWDQEGEFPREDIDPVPNDAIPKQIKLGQMELLRFVLAADRDAANDARAVKRRKMDVIEVEYEEGARQELIPEIVRRIISPFVTSFDAGGAGGAPSSSAVFVERA